MHDSPGFQHLEASLLQGRSQAASAVRFAHEVRDEAQPFQQVIGKQVARADDWVLQVIKADKQFTAWS